MGFEGPVDQLRAHALMLANLHGAPVYWLHFAQIYAELPGRPVMLLARAETCAIIHVELEGPRVLRTHYREAGLYFEPASDRPLTEYTNPVTDNAVRVETGFREGPAVFTYSATDDGVFGNTELDPKTTRRMPWTWRSSGSRVWMVNEDAGVWRPADPTSKNVQAHDPTFGRILQTWHADGHDLDDKDADTVPCFKTYVMASSAWASWAGDPGERGGGFVRGMGAKLTPREADAYPEMARLKRAHPDFFGEGGTPR